LIAVVLINIPSKWMLKRGTVVILAIMDTSMP
jgi:hypothetical protein